MDIETRIESTISNLFGRLDMRKGSANHKRASNLLNFCMDDINEHPTLVDALQTDKALEFLLFSQ